MNNGGRILSAIIGFILGVVTCGIYFIWKANRS